MRFEAVESGRMEKGKELEGKENRMWWKTEWNGMEEAEGREGKRRIKREEEKRRKEKK